MVNKVPVDGLEMQLQATDITQQRDSVPSDLISGFRSINEDLQGQTFLTCLLYTNSEQREKRREKDTVNLTACSALEQMLAHAWCLPCFYQTIKHLWIKENNSNLDCLKHACFSPSHLYAEGVKAERHLNVLTEGPSKLHQESSTQETSTTDFKPSTVTSAHFTNIVVCPKFTWIPDYREVICNRWLDSSPLCDLRYRLQRALEHVVADMKSLFYKCFS